MALRRVLTGDAFFAKIEPYRAIWAIALPPDYASIASRAGTEDVSAQDASTSGRDEERAPCANCWGVSVSNAYLNLASARGVVMIRGGNDSRASPPTPSLVRMMMPRDAAAARPGGVLLTPTDHRDPVKVTIEDANRLADALRARDPRLRDVPFGFWDGPAGEPSVRENELLDDDSDKPAASRVAKFRLQAFLDQTQGALNTFG